MNRYFQGKIKSHNDFWSNRKHKFSDAWSYKPCQKLHTFSSENSIIKLFKWKESAGYQPQNLIKTYIVQRHQYHSWACVSFSSRFTGSKRVMICWSCSAVTETSSLSRTWRTNTFLTPMIIAWNKSVQTQILKSNHNWIIYLQIRL